MRVKGKDLGCAMLVAYVDDVLVASENETVEQAIEQEIGKVVPVKCTGWRTRRWKPNLYW